MTLRLAPKPTLQEFIPTCTPLAIIESLELEYQQRVEQITDHLAAYAGGSDAVENLTRFLRQDRDFLGIVLALMNLSQEKFLRILSAERFARQDFDAEWSIDKVHSKITRDKDFALELAKLFLEGKNNPRLNRRVANFYLEQVSLPDNWHLMIQNRDIIGNVIRRKLSGEYNDRKGEAIEAIVRTRLDEIQTRYGVPHTKGQVPLVGKEVDHVLPSIEDPYVLIMTSYMETTGSGQTARANEQSEMYRILEGSNIRHGTKRILINFVDGAGWLARRTDLRKMVDGCHQVINLKTLDRLEAVVCKSVPESYFKGRRPQVEG